MSDGVRGVRISAARLNTSKPRRTLDERLFVRFPRLARAFGRGIFRLRQGSPLRRVLLLRLASQAASAVNRRDFDVLFAGFHPDMTYTVEGWGLAPDLIGVHQGYAGYREAWRRMLEAFEDIRLEPEELIDFGGGLVSTTRLSGHGGGSGVPFNQTFWQVFWFEDGLVVRQQDFVDRADAFEAAGLSE
jgi:ketosteroid isomerase-like protein